VVTSPAEVLWTTRYDYQPRSKLEHHKHKFVQIICIRSGEGRFWLDGTPKFGLPSTHFQNPEFGLISTQSNHPRQIQLGMKLYF
jgi:hypothetical protein